MNSIEKPPINDSYQLKSLTTSEFFFENIRGHDSLDDMLNEMAKEINASIKALLEEVKPSERVHRVQIKWLNVPERLRNPDKNIGNWRVLLVKVTR